MANIGSKAVNAYNEELTNKYPFRQYLSVRHVNGFFIFAIYIYIYIYI